MATQLYKQLVKEEEIKEKIKEIITEILQNYSDKGITEVNFENFIKKFINKINKEINENLDLPNFNLNFLRKEIEGTNKLNLILSSSSKKELKDVKEGLKVLKTLINESVNKNKELNKIKFTYNTNKRKQKKTIDNIPIKILGKTILEEEKKEISKEVFSKYFTTFNYKNNLQDLDNNYIPYSFSPHKLEVYTDLDFLPELIKLMLILNNSYINFKNNKGISKETINTIEDYFKSLKEEDIENNKILKEILEENNIEFNDFKNKLNSIVNNVEKEVINKEMQSYYSNLRST